MHILDTHKTEYHMLRTRLYNLEFKLAVQAKILTEEEYKAYKKQIEEIKNSMAHLALISKEENNKGEIKK